MAKIVLGFKTQQTNYFEIGYTFTLSIPVSQIGKENQATTKEVSGIASYADGTSIEDIQTDLIKRYDAEQDKLNMDTKLAFYGISWDGSKWS